MSRIKLILSILLMLFLLLVAIFLPSRLRKRNETPDTKSQEETASQEESNQPEKLTEMDFLSFEELSQFFSSAQTVSCLLYTSYSICAGILFTHIGIRKIEKMDL